MCTTPCHLSTDSLSSPKTLPLVSHSAYSDDFGSFLRRVQHLHWPLHCKKAIPGQGEFGLWHPGWDGKTANLFSQCIYTLSSSMSGMRWIQHATSLYSKSQLICFQNMEWRHLHPTYFRTSRYGRQPKSTMWASLPTCGAAATFPSTPRNGSGKSQASTVLCLG